MRESDLGGQGEEEEEGEDVQELEEGLETDLCRLWDASMNTVRPVGVSQRPPIRYFPYGYLGNSLLIHVECIHGSLPSRA